MYTIPASDSLMDQYYQLKAQNEIPDMKEYADQFRIIAAQFCFDGRVCMAQSCMSMYSQYLEWAEYLPVAEKMQMDGYVEFKKTDEETPEYNWQERSDLK